MTDRLKGLAITFEKDIREDDAEEIIKAIGMLRGVASVKPVVTEINDMINQERVKYELRSKVYKFFSEELK
jgi:hypothetical protein